MHTKSIPPLASRPIVVLGQDPSLIKRVRAVTEHPTRLQLPVDEAEVARLVVSATPPRLVVVDLDRDGIETVRRLKRLRPHCRVPMLLILKRARPTDLVAGVNAGAKPFCPNR